MYTLTETERIALVAAHTYSPVIIAAPDRKIVWVNQAFTNLTGYSLDEVKGRTPSSLLHCENTDPKTVDEIRQKLDNKEKFEAALINRNKLGREYWVRIAVSPVNIGDRFAGYISVENEITKEVELLNSLRESELKYRAIFNSSSDRHVFVDKNLVLRAYNKAAKINFKENLGINIFEGDDFKKALVTPQIERLFYHAFEQAINGKEFYFEEEVDLVTDVKQWYLFKGTPVYDENNQIIGAGFNWRENTKEKHLAELLEESELKYKAIMDSTEDRHVLVDLNNKILAFNKSAQKNLSLALGYEMKEGDDFVDYFNGHQANFELLQGLAKAKAGEVFLHENKTTTPALTRWIKISYRPVYNNIEKVMGVSINWTDITAQKEAEQKVLEQLQQLREFSYITSHKLRQPLANIIGITDLINAGSPEDIPALIEQLKDMARGLDHVINDMSKTVAAANYAEPPVDTVIEKDNKPKLIYIIDDDPVNNMITRKLLQRNIAGVKVEEFLDGPGAINTLKHGLLPDLILLDINMHPMDGWKFLREFEKLKVHVPIVMCSSSVDPDDLRRAKENPLVNTFMSKPLTKELIQELYNLPA